MKYPSMPKRKYNTFRIPALDGGINLAAISDKIGENQLKMGKNVWYEGGVLTSRSGLSPKASLYEEYSEVIFKDFEFTDIHAVIGSKRCRMAYYVVGDSISFQRLKVLFIDENGEIERTTVMAINRIADDEYYRFKSVFFVSGKATTGSGIYAFLKRECEKHGELYAVYELSKNYDNWVGLKESQFYVPIVLLNGVGNNYNYSLESGMTDPFTPTSPESPNLLTGAFKAYYTSDEYSSSFNLPFRNIKEDSAVNCRLYVSPSFYYEWNIKAGKDSDTIPYYSMELTMLCDRTAGTIEFRNPQGETYPIPRMGRARKNNIVVTAVQSKNSMGAVAGCIGATVHDSSFYVYGNPEGPSVIRCATLQNPLYFSEYSKTQVGEPNEPITALAVQQNKLIAFKKREIYKIDKIKSVSKEADTLLDVQNDYFTVNSLSSSPIHSLVGCWYPKTLRLCGNKLIWMGEGHRIYTLNTTTYGKTNNVYELSLPLGSSLYQIDEDEVKDSCAVYHKEHYILFVGNKAFLMDCKIRNFGTFQEFSGLNDAPKSISWYIWEFPGGRVHSAEGLGDNLFVVKGNDTQSLRIYSMNGDSDNVYEGLDNPSNYSIASEIESGRLYLGETNALKNINEIFFQYSSVEELKLSLSTDKHSFCIDIPSHNDIKTLCILASFRAANWISFRLCSEKKMSLGEININFDKTCFVR